MIRGPDPSDFPAEVLQKICGFENGSTESMTIAPQNVAPTALAPQRQCPHDTFFGDIFFSTAVA